VAAGAKHRLVHALQKHLANPPMRALLRAGVAPPGCALLETIGRRSGEPRRTPVGDGLVDGSDTFWLVAEHGFQSGYVRNMQANPRIRLKIGRRWRTGTAHPLPDDDPVARQASMPQLNARAVRVFGTDLLTIRIDLDPLA
jgi:deazaflavin-dependent oxidoreductase (nitroreductase family)